MIPLFDTHQHLIYRHVDDYAWTAGIPALQDKSFTFGNYQCLTQGLSICGTLFMESGADESGFREEARHVSNLARDPTSLIKGLIVNCRPEAVQGFEAWLEEARGLGALGFRRILHVVDDEVSRTVTFRANVRRIGAAGLTFDMCFLARQLPIACELAMACDNTRLILDHCGVPDIAGGGLAPWRDLIRRLAAFPNVICKLSGVLAYCAPGQATYEAILPYVDHVLECFGPVRMVWGSDWPVVNMANGLPDWIAVTRRILAQLSETEAELIAHRNAPAIYGAGV
jgi:predicted TIM-barrel fold metal-dependent hydrolase